MKGRLRALMVEDNPDDCELVLRELRKGGYEPDFERVETAEAMGAALERRSWEVVFSDWSMPSFSATAALELLKKTGLDLPFIIVSGTIGEETAVEALRTGAHDFLVKNRLARLVPAVERELREAKMRIERVKMQEQLMVSDRMASVGILAAGVAHEINNPLAGVMSCVTALREGKLPPERREEYFGAIRDGLERMRQTVQGLLDFARPQDPRPEDVDAAELVEACERLLAAELRKKRVEIESALGKGAAVVHGDRSQLVQALMNVLLNALHASPEGSRITVRAVRAEERVGVEVVDRGPGIPKKDVPRVFDPFFSTKPQGQGTGLGLSVTLGIVRAHGGEIEIESEERKGTTVTLWLPKGNL